MPAEFEELLIDHSYMCNALGDLIAAWHTREDVGPLRMELLEPLAARIGLVSASLEDLLAGTTRGRYTDNPVTIPDLPSIYTIARSQLEAYLNFYYLFIGPSSDEERELKYKLYVIGGLTARQSLKEEFEQLYAETQDTRIPALLVQIQQEADRIIRLRQEVTADALFNSMYNVGQRGTILSLRQPRARTQNWIDIIRASPLNTAAFSNRWNLYSGHAHTEYIGLLQLRDYIMDMSTHNSYTRDTCLKGSMMILSTFIGQFVAYLHLESHYNELHPELRQMIEFWQMFSRAE